MSARPPVEAISLDVDGTLYRVRRMTVAWRLRHVRGLLVAMVAAREKIRHEGLFPSLEALHRREAELVAPSFELSVDEASARLDEIRDALPGALTDRLPPFSGVRGALEAAVARGLKLAILSDYDAQQKLENLGLADLPWSAKVSAEAAGALKPHRASFDAVSEALGIPPERIVHVGDREDVDVTGALAAGMRAWRLTSKRRAPTRAEHRLPRWKLDAFAPLWTSDGESSS